MVRSWRLSLFVGLAVFAAAWGSHWLIFESTNGGHWSSFVLSALTGFISCGLARMLTSEAVAPLARLAPDAAEPPEPLGASAWLAAGFGAVVGIAVIPFFNGDLAYLFRAASWTVELARSVLVNMCLFGMMGMLAVAGARRDRWIGEEVAPRVPIDLLDLAPLAAFGRSGGEAAGFWLGGSCIAALLFIEFPFSLLHTAILATTAALGASALVRPMRCIRERILAARSEELVRVRAELHRARSDPQGRADLEGLLAWEHRIGEIQAWPFDFGSALRLSALGAAAIGSWLGGALIERVVDATLTN